MAKISIAKKEENENNIFNGYDRSELSPQGKKLLKEWRKIEHLCKNSDVISYIIRKRNREGLPVEYEIIYNLKSIVGIENPTEETININGNSEKKSVRKPKYANEHRLSINLPNNYPNAYGGNPEFRMISDTWHPNIRSAGKFKGRICMNDKDLGVAVGLDKRIIRVGKYLQYQTYWANDSYPWPEDQNVAEWIREEAETMGWVNSGEGIFVDNSKLFKKDYILQKEDQIKIEE
ncbi:MAG: hypothetical protein K8R74_01855, partial [Bacteroidales bacterium]|nr:hypothetical protein [Bacteroidales bacterium]